MANRLAKETSPYLLQHKNNPVDWYPWGEEALQRAKQENRPILLSIGYSACHWCHVMEHESFENTEIAQMMNDRFINIKVDREERPDLDQIYQNVAQALTRSGGWPLTVFLTPELKPYFGGTYFPPEDKYGRPGLPRVLTVLSDAYQNDRQSVEQNAFKLTEIMGAMDSVAIEENKVKLSFTELEKAAEELLSHVDWENGGIGSAPKFPVPMTLVYLWRFGRIKSNSEAQNAVLLTLTKMAKGGIYDQLGGGFHRYSVDGTWSVPHFEKMLYDNALLLKLYSEVLLTADQGQVDQELFLSVVRETTQYLFREMLSPEGLFYSAQDADSEGEEGKFFVWDLTDLANHLSADEAKVFALYYGVKEGGNFEHGKTVLFVENSLQNVSKQCGISENETALILKSARMKLLEVRTQRIAPSLDDKSLVSWNGLMISGLAWASQALEKGGESELSEKAWKAAESAYQFVVKNLGQNFGQFQNRLYSTYQKGKPKLNAYLDDYAFMAMAGLDLTRFSTSIESVKERIEQAEKWVDVILKHFKSERGFFFTSDDHEKLIHRPKTVFDQAIPSGTAVTLTAMAVLAELGREDYQSEVERQLETLYSIVTRNAHGLGELLCASLIHTSGPVTVSGAGSSRFCENPHVFQKPSLEGSGDSRVILCHRKTCQAPLDASDEVRIKTEIRKLVQFESGAI